jgi:hypothetical protein
MTRNYSSFADICMLMSGGQPWALDMQRRSGNPVLMAYMVNSLTALLIGKPAIPEQFLRAKNGLLIGSAQPVADLAPAPMVYLALRYAKSKLTKDGNWLPDIDKAVEAACPEIGMANEGDVIADAAAGHWSMQLAKGDWFREFDATMARDREIMNVPSR